MLPALVASFLCFLLACFHLPTEFSKGWDAPDLSDADLLSKLHLIYRPESVYFSDWIRDVLYLVDPFRFGTVNFPRYDYPLWTMPVEYMGSMAVFTVVVGTSLLRPVFRSLLLAFLTWFCLWYGRGGHWQWCLFIGGVLIADLAYKSPPMEPVSYLPLAERVDEEDSSTAVEEVPAEKISRPSPWSALPVFLDPKSYTAHLDRLSPYLTQVRCFLSMLGFLLAIHLGSFPDGDPSATATAPGYGWLSQFVQMDWALFAGYFFPDLGALLLVFVLSKADFLQKIFTTRIAQYLGDISLSIYMLHVLILTTVGNWLIVHCLIATRGLGGWGFPITMTIALSCCAIVTFWIADIYWRLVDTRSIHFARWVSEEAFVKEK
jgi:peptidoglycan/LPS O-acetylase OafA/YrhL